MKAITKSYIVDAVSKLCFNRRKRVVVTIGGAGSTEKASRINLRFWVGFVVRKYPPGNASACQAHRAS